MFCFMFDSIERNSAKHDWKRKEWERAVSGSAHS